MASWYKPLVSKDQVLKHDQTDRWTDRRTDGWMDRRVDKDYINLMHYWVGFLVGPDTLDLRRIISADIFTLFAGCMSFILWFYTLQSIFNPINFFCLNQTAIKIQEKVYTTFLLNVRWWSYYFLTWNFLKIKPATHFCAVKINCITGDVAF